MTKQQSSALNKILLSVANIGIGKYNLPNIFNGFGLRLINWSNRIGLKFIRAASALNLKQENYEHNRKIITQCTSTIDKIIQPNYKKLTAQLLDIKTWCQQQHLPFKIIETEQQIYIAEPNLINPPSQNTHRESGQALLPENYLAELNNVTVIGGSNLILADRNRIVLNDEIHCDTDKRYCLKNPYIKLSDDDNVTVKYINRNKLIEPVGIHFCADYSHNYYHWLIECLPRLYILDQFSDYDKMPLLHDENLTTQQLSALNIMNTRDRPLIRFKKGHLYNIKKLIVPSMSSVIHDNYHSPVAYDKDVLISPTAIHYVRNHVLQTLGCTTKNGFRKLFISRKKSEHRRLLNLEEIEALMIARGFEIVFPESLTFTNQVKLFSQAQVVVGQTGAGFANLMFCPENCKALILINHHKQTNYYLFSNLAQILNIDLQFVPGNDVIEHFDKSLQNDFVISKSLLSHTLDSLENKELECRVG